jgi:hypothetical protein
VTGGRKREEGRERSRKREEGWRALPEMCRSLGLMLIPLQ